MRDTIATPAISALQAAAALRPGLDAITALRAGDATAAATLAHLPTAEYQLRTAWRLRGSIYPRSGIDNMTTAVWRDPTVLDHDALAGLEPGLERWLAAIRQGAVMWFPTYAEADAAQCEIERAR